MRRQKLLVPGFILVFILLLNGLSVARGSPVNDTSAIQEEIGQHSPLSEQMWPMPVWSTATSAEVGMDEAKLIEARQYALTEGGGSGYITRHGKLVMSWGDPRQIYDIKSTTKSIGVTALGLAALDNRLSLSDLVKHCHPDFGIPPGSNADTGWLDNITILNLATHTGGFDKIGGYSQLLFEPGTRWFYSDGGTNWLAECLTLEYGLDMNTLLFDRVFTILGITAEDLTWRDNLYRPDTINGIKRREFGSGISANVDAMARIGYLYLRNGQWTGEQIIPQSFVDKVATAVPEVVGLPVHDPDISFNAPDHYGLLWWNNADSTLANVPEDAYWSWGLGESLIVVIPTLDIVAARAGSSWQNGSVSNYEVIKPFLEPIALSVIGQAPPNNSIFLPLITSNNANR